MVRKILPDKYLKKFFNFCKKEYGENLIGLGIYGSYTWGYFDKEKSDYDVFLIFENKIKDETEFLSRKFPKISVQYFCDLKDIFDLISEGHWTLYITLLESARMLYSTKKYKEFISKLKKINFINNLKNFDRIKLKAKFDREQLSKETGYSGAKHAFPALRSRLQLLTYINTKKLIWDLTRNINLNNSFFTFEEKNYFYELGKSVRNRKDVFPNKELAINLLNKINERIIFLLDNLN